MRVERDVELARSVVKRIVFHIAEIEGPAPCERRLQPAFSAPRGEVAMRRMMLDMTISVCGLCESSAFTARDGMMLVYNIIPANCVTAQRAGHISIAPMKPFDFGSGLW